VDDNPALLWLPVDEMIAEVTVAALTSLFGTQGAPLLLKCDNGPPFHAERTTDFVAALLVQMLFSQAYTPRYNGGIEADIGALKTRMWKLHGGKRTRWRSCWARTGRFLARDTRTAKPKEIWSCAQSPC
jgi:hypothetical protein